MPPRSAGRHDQRRATLDRFGQRQCSTSGEPRRRVILAPKASRSWLSASTAAPSTAVSPATASTASLNESCQPRGCSPPDRLLDDLRQRHERRRHGVGDRVHDRVAPLVAARGHDQQRAAAAVRAHRHRQLHEHVHRADPRLGGVKPQQRGEQVGAIGQRGRGFVHQLHVVAFQHRHVDVLAGLRAPMVLHDQQPRLHHLQHEAEHGDVLRGAPHAQLAVDAPDAQVDARALDDRRQLGERGRGAAAAGARRRAVARPARAACRPARSSARSLLRAGGWPRRPRRSPRESPLRPGLRPRVVPGARGRQMPREVGVDLGRGQPGRRVAVEGH